MRERAALLAVSVALAAASCGRALPDRLSLICASETACGYFPDYDACLRGHPVSAPSAPLRAVYHRDVHERCFEAALDYGCYQRGVPYRFDCPGAYTGLVAEGGACASDVECIEGRCDRSACGTDVCCAGACVPPPLLAPDPIGASCVTSSCVSEAYCHLGHCVPRLSDGAPCDVPDACAPGLVCMGNTCRAFGLAGDACDADRVCEPNSAFCAPDGHCAANLPLGASCDDAHPCIFFAACASGTCVRRGDVGEPCTNGCYVSLSCEAGVCTPNHPATLCP